MQMIEQVKTFFKQVTQTQTLPSDIDDVLLKHCFSLVVKYVEMVANSNVPGVKKEADKEKAGITGLEWMIANERAFNLSRSEAISEIKTLYIWWTQQRIKREDPWSKITATYNPDWKVINLEDPDCKEFIDQCKFAEKMCNLYYTEDSKMLSRMIKIRKYLQV